jgi:hypothetical protein
MLTTSDDQELDQPLGRRLFSSTYTHPRLSRPAVAPICNPVLAP